MKLKQIESILKSKKYIVLYEAGEGQWIGDGASLYPIYGMPYLTKENILVMWDVPEDKRNAWNFRDGEGLDPDMFEDTTDTEQLVERGMSVISICGAAAEPLKTKQGILFVNQKYLRPFDDLENGYDLYARLDRTGTPYIAVKQGYALVGLIMPMRVIDTEFISELEELLSLSHLAFNNHYGTKIETGV